SRKILDFHHRCVIGGFPFLPLNNLRSYVLNKERRIQNPESNGQIIPDPESFVQFPSLHYCNN
ncbi:MAG: hypothetical protein JXB88_12790, partial [Spirochaetales bacterium]|nr:hypothetical protein [Spirochaetales bacterium]